MQGNYYEDKSVFVSVWLVPEKESDQPKRYESNKIINRINFLAYFNLLDSL